MHHVQMARSIGKSRKSGKGKGNGRGKNGDGGDEKQQKGYEHRAKGSVEVG